MTGLMIAMLVCGAPTQDARHIENGWEIPSQGYADQPYVVVTEDGTWVCTMTTGPGREGDQRQHVVSSRSTDQGKTWEPLLSIEPEGPPEASWVMPLLVPSGRIYAFYLYNKQNLREVKNSDGKMIKRVDTLGSYMFKFSDDQGRSWPEERYEIPIRAFEIDRDNIYGGDVRFFWGVGKPIIFQGAAYIGLAKVGGFGKGFLEETEGFFLKSTNILTETDPAAIEWQTLPKGDIGLRAPAGPIAEEHNLVGLSTGALYCTYRTTQGHPCHAYSHDGGETWTAPAYMTYTPEGRMVKHPRAANFVWKASNGKYLYWFHNHGGKSYADRNPAWLCGGVERDGKLHWSQPEILLYADDPKMRMSYPCLVEDQGDFFITETQKSIARVHAIEPHILEAVWNQFDLAEVPREGLVLEADACPPGSEHALPPMPDLSAREGFSVAFWLRLNTLEAGEVLLDSRTPAGAGFSLATADDGAVRFTMSDGQHTAECDSDPGIMRPGTWHHVAVIADGGPKIITFVIDDRLCDGAEVREQGWYRFDPAFAAPNGVALRVGPGKAGELGGLRVYDRYLLTSEAIGAWRAGL